MDDDAAEHLVVLHSAVGVGDLVEWEAGPDHGLDAALGDQFQCAGDLRPGGVAAAGDHDLVARRRVEAVIGARFSLDDAAKAYGAMQCNEVFGRIVVDAAPR